MVISSVVSKILGTEGSNVLAKSVACIPRECPKDITHFFIAHYFQRMTLIFRPLMCRTKQWVGEAVTAAVQKEVGAAVREQVEKMSPEARQEEEKKKKQVWVQLGECIVNTAFY